MPDNPSIGLAKRRSFKDKYIGYKNSDKYYSGADATVYFNTVYVPEITSISFNGVPQDRPIFGYSDENWSAMSKGNYIVEGQVTINFVETGYLFKAIRMAWADFYDNTGAAGFKKQITDTEKYKRSIDFLEKQKDPSRYSIDGYAEYYKQAKEASNELKKQIWKQDASQQLAIYRLDQLTGLRAHDGGKTVPPLDIIIMYGNVNDDTHQLHKLTDVRFVGTSQTIMNDGTPVQEVYTFVARDLDPPEDFYGFQADFGEVKAQKDLTENLYLLMDAVCDGLFSLITKKDALKIGFDLTHMVDKDEVTVLPPTSNRQSLAFENKDVISATITSKFNSDNTKIWNIVSNNNFDLKLLRPLCLANMLVDHLNTVPAPDVAIAQATNSALMRSYVASLLDSIAYVNPYMIVRYSRFIAPIDGAENKDVLDGNIFGTVYDNKSFKYKMADSTKYTNKLLCLENWNVFAENDRIYFDTLSNVSGDDSKKAILINSLKKTNYESYPEDKLPTMQAIGKYGTYRPSWFNFTISPTGGDIKDQALYSVKANLAKKKFVTHYYSPLSVGLSRQLPSNLNDINSEGEAAKMFDISYVEYPACLGYQKYYTEDGMPLSSHFIPTDTTDGRKTYTIEVYEKDEDGDLTSTEWLDIPEQFKAKKNFTAYVFVDGVPCLTEGVSVEFENDKFKLTFTAYKGFDEGFSKIRVILVDTDKQNRLSVVSPVSEREYLKAQTLYGYHKQMFVEQPDGTFVLKNMSQTEAGLKSVYPVLKTKLIASTVIPSFLLSRSQYTKRVIKKYLQSIMAFCDQYQFMFDFQVFADSLIYDLEQSKSNLPAKYQFSVLTEQMKVRMREQFRARFLKNSQTYVLPKGIDIRLAGPKQRQVLVTTMSDRISDATIANIMTKGSSELSNFNFNASVKDIKDENKLVDPISVHLILGKAAAREKWSYRQYLQRLTTTIEVPPSTPLVYMKRGCPYMFLQGDSGTNQLTVMPSQIVHVSNLEQAMGYLDDTFLIYTDNKTGVHKNQNDNGIGNIIYQQTLTDEHGLHHLISNDANASAADITTYLTNGIPIADLVIDKFRELLEDHIDNIIDIRKTKTEKPSEDKTGIIIKAYRFILQSMSELKIYKNIFPGGTS